MFADLNSSRLVLYINDKCLWVIGFSGEKYSTMLASLIFEVVEGIWARFTLAGLGGQMPETINKAGYGYQKDGWLAESAMLSVPSIDKAPGIPGRSANPPAILQ